MSPIPRPNDGSDYTRHFGRISDFERRRSDLVVFSLALPFLICVVCGLAGERAESSSKILSRSSEVNLASFIMHSALTEIEVEL